MGKSTTASHDAASNKELSRWCLKSKESDAQVKACRKSLEAAQRKGKDSMVKSLEAKLATLLEASAEAKRNSSVDRYSAPIVEVVKLAPISKSAKPDDAETLPHSKNAVRNTTLLKTKGDRQRRAKTTKEDDIENDVGDEQSAIDILLRASAAAKEAEDEDDDEEGVDVAQNWWEDPDLKQLMAERGPEEAEWDFERGVKETEDVDLEECDNDDDARRRKAVRDSDEPKKGASADEPSDVKQDAKPRKKKKRLLKKRQTAQENVKQDDSADASDFFDTEAADTETGTATLRERPSATLKVASPDGANAVDSNPAPKKKKLKKRNQIVEVVAASVDSTKKTASSGGKSAVLASAAGGEALQSMKPLQSTRRLKKIRRKERRERLKEQRTQWHPSWGASKRANVSGKLVKATGKRKAFASDSDGGH